MKQPKGTHATAADYSEALSGLSDREQHLLLVHYSFPSHRATPRQLADYLGYESYGAANLMYGKIGGKVGVFLHPRLPDPLQRSRYLWGNLGTYDTDEPEVAWTLRPELVQALENMPWLTSKRKVARVRTPRT